MPKEEFYGIKIQPSLCQVQKKEFLNHSATNWELQVHFAGI